MDEQLIPSSKGPPTVTVGNLLIHSRFDPVGEAARYVANLPLEGTVTIFILIEPALGYLVGPLKKRFPRSRVLSIHCSSFFLYQVPQIKEIVPPDFQWSPDSPLSLYAFLEQHLREEELPGVKVLEWRPSLRAYQERALDVLKGVNGFLKFAHANQRTQRAFGLRWFKNAIKNSSLDHPTFILRKTNQAVLVVGAGPSVENQGAGIIEFQREKKGIVIAVSSAVQALLERDIRPDLVVTTDGGPWAQHHLFPLLREAARGKPIPLVASLTAYPHSRMEGLPILYSNDGSLWQNLLLQRKKLPHFTLPQRGTVTATAIDVALYLSKAPIFVLGMDLSHRDLQTHVRPYALDWYVEQGVSRLAPHYSLVFERSRKIISGGSLDVYARWFEEHRGLFKNRVYSFLPDHPFLPFLKDGVPNPLPVSDGSWIEFLPKTDCARAIPLRRSFETTLEDDRNARVLLEELNQLFFCSSDGGTESGILSMIDQCLARYE